MNMAMQIPNIQAVFFDIDGTLVSFKTHAIPPSTKEAINQLRNKGIKVVISTGRSLRDINNLEDLEFDGFVTANGAYCVDSKGDVIAQHQFSKDNLERLAVYLKEKPFACTFVTDQGNFINFADDMMLSLTKLVGITLPPVRPVAEIMVHNILQLDAYIDIAQETELLNHILMDCIGCRWHPVFVDINTNNCSKATGIDCFKVHFGIENGHTMAFGDGGNDISMLQHATIGVAMGNAKDQVKAAADYVTSSVDEDGIVKTLKHFNILQ